MHEDRGLREEALRLPLAVHAELHLFVASYVRFCLLSEVYFDMFSCFFFLADFIQLVVMRLCYFHAQLHLRESGDHVGKPVVIRLTVYMRFSVTLFSTS